MISAAMLWARRLWPYVFGFLFGSGIVVAVFRACHGDPAPSLAPAHQATAVAAQLVAITDTIFVHDTIERTKAVTVYRATRDTVLKHLTDTVLVKQALADADNALDLDSTAIRSAARAINALKVQASALRTELAISERLRAPRFTASSDAGFEFTSSAPVTGAEGVARIAGHWSLVGRIEKRWAPGEPTRRLLFVRYTL